MSARPHRPATHRLEAWLWTGPVGHLVGGILDFAGVLAKSTIWRRTPARPRRGR